jgi:hypothetical protein
MSSSLSDSNYPEDVRRASIEVDELLHLLKHLVRSQLELTEYLSSPEGSGDSDIYEAMRDNEISIVNMNARIDELLMLLPQSDPRKQLLNRSRSSVDATSGTRSEAAPLSSSSTTTTAAASTSGGFASVPIPSAAEALAEETDIPYGSGVASADNNSPDNDSTAGGEADGRGGIYL